MTPHYLRLKGFIGIRSGMGLEEIEIDLDGLLQSQLIAITGPNGHGKTTILDSMHPYRLMPFRASSYSPRAFNYGAHTYGTAEKELIWTHGGRRYRTLVIIKGGRKTTTQNAYLYVADEAGEWQPYEASDGTKSDGKTGVYDACVEDVMGSPELFFTSAYAAQNRKTLDASTAGEIKSLMSELLGHDQVIALHKRAKQVTDGLKAHRAAIATDVEAAKRVAIEVETLDSTIARLQADNGMRVQARYTAQDNLRRAQSHYADVEAAARANTELEIRRNGLRQRIETTAARRDKALQEIGAEQRDLEYQHGERRAALSASISAADRRIATTESQITETTKLLDAKAEIEAAAESVPALESDLAARQAELKTLQQRIDEWIAERARVAQAKADVAVVIEAGKSATAQYEALQARSALISEVPCAGTDLQCNCKLLEDATMAAAKLPDVQAERDRQGRLYTEALAKYRAMNEALGDDPSPQREPLQSEINRAQEALTAARDVAAKLSSVQAAADMLASLREQLAEQQDQRTANQAELDSLDERHASSSAALQARKETVTRDADADLAELQRELASIPVGDATELESAERALADADEALAAIQKKIDECTAELSDAKSRHRTAAARQRELGDTLTAAERLDEEIAYWSTLQYALGNDGVIALAIDDAGPTLTSLANDLLTACYGPRFTVRIDTQRDKADGSKKEVFDIIVFDAERDDEKSLSDTSGGERIWINEALTRSIALYMGQASSIPIETTFSDESDGALDPERKAMFLAMKRKAIELGGFEREFYISHSPDVWGAADARIDVTKITGTTAPEATAA